VLPRTAWTLGFDDAIQIERGPVAFAIVRARGELGFRFREVRGRRHRVNGSRGVADAEDIRVWTATDFHRVDLMGSIGTRPLPVKLPKVMFAGPTPRIRFAPWGFFSTLSSMLLPSRPNVMEV
jgi:hypothetical protein